MFKLKSKYLNQLIIVSLILVSLYLFARIGYHGPAHKRAYLIYRLFANLGFPLILMVFGALFLNKDKNLLHFDEKNIDSNALKKICDIDSNSLNSTDDSKSRSIENEDKGDNRKFLTPLKELYSYLLPPFLFWALICIILKALFLNIGDSPFEILIASIKLFFSSNWFIWIILCSVLVIPILNEFIKMEKKEGLNYFIILFVIASILWSLSKQFNFSLYYIDLVFFAEPFAYMVLGYYLDNMIDMKNHRKLFLVSIIIFIITFAIRSYLVFKGYVGWNKFFMEIFGSKISLSLDIFTIIECSAIFLMFKSINCNEIYNKISNANIVNKILGYLGRNAYPLFLVLILVTSILTELKLSLPTNFIFYSIIMTIVFLVIGGILLFILDKIPYLNKIIGTRLS